MADELKNAYNLMQDQTLRGMVMAATVYEATQVAVEDPATADHDIRYTLAQRVIQDPNFAVEYFQRIISCDPAVATLGEAFDVVPESAVLDKVSGAWTAVAQLVLT